MPVTIPKNQPSEIYSKLRNSIAHSNIIFQNNQEILLDIDSDENILGIIGDVEKIKDELIIIAGILSQITALYQIINQSYNSNKNHN
jgi:hypothetical protein